MHYYCYYYYYYYYSYYYNYYYSSCMCCWLYIYLICISNTYRRYIFEIVLFVLCGIYFVLAHLMPHVFLFCFMFYLSRFILFILCFIRFVLFFVLCSSRCFCICFVVYFLKFILASLPLDVQSIGGYKSQRRSSAARHHVNSKPSTLNPQL